MSRKSRIVVALVALGLASAAASPPAFAGSPLLSGYGGPGAGEQAIVGSTLIGGSGGGAGSGGSSGSTGSSGSGSAGGGSASGATSALTGVSSAGGGSGGKGAAGNRRGSSHAAGSASTRAGASNTGAQIHAFVYPTGPRSASADSPALGISGADLLLFLAAIATLALVAAATLRLSRLQRRL